MKADIHPKYAPVLFTCASCGTEYLIQTTRLDGAKREYHGREYPSMTLEICSQCHPFFSGKHTYVDTAGRVEKFQRRYGSLTGKKEPGTAKRTADDEKARATGEAAAAAPSAPANGEAAKP